MVMSDRIALLRMGELEQVASPREIYSHPATAYTAQFIGHTNLLRGEVRAGIAHCNSLSWRIEFPDGPALFSLRPENIRLATSAARSSDMSAVHLNGKIQHQAFHGATELLQVVCDDGLTLSVRTATRENRQGDVQLEFSPADAVPVRESPERG
jgi:putative spermidine/putrescine transport system ATP-binding protein